jgi:hypothetical protein
MPRVCGIDFKSSEAILAVIEEADGHIEFIDIEPRKIRIGDDESSIEIRSFFDSFNNFIRDNRIDIVVLKKRAKRGPMAGGAVSFKLEALIQMNGLLDVIFVSGQGIAAENKKIPFQIPEELKKYQEAAFSAAALHIRRTAQ